jgi:hypothetical protein
MTNIKYFQNKEMREVYTVQCTLHSPVLYGEKPLTWVAVRVSLWRSLCLAGSVTKIKRLADPFL